MLMTVLMAAGDPVTKGDVGVFALVVIGCVIALVVIGAVLSAISNAYRH